MLSPKDAFRMVKKEKFKKKINSKYKKKINSKFKKKINLIDNSNKKYRIFLNHKILFKYECKVD
jgi:hypothetical protein